MYANVLLLTACLSNTLDTAHMRKIPGSHCLHNFIVHIPVWGNLGMRLENRVWTALLGKLRANYKVYWHVVAPIKLLRDPSKLCL